MNKDTVMEMIASLKRCKEQNIKTHREDMECIDRWINELTQELHKEESKDGKVQSTK